MAAGRASRCGSCFRRRRPVERKLRLVDGAIGKKAAPRIGLEGAERAAVEPEVDAVKDKALIDAFSAAVAAAMG